MSNPEQRYKKMLTGRRARGAGEHWETIIDLACSFYSMEGIAEIAKTPEPMRPISPPNKKGQFLSCFTKKAQPDYKGTIRGGRSVVFEAKHTDSDRISRNVVSKEQESQLNKHLSLGAECFVLVSFGFQHFYKIPWNVFRNMKSIYGRKYIKPIDVEEYAISVSGGFLRFLN